VDIHKITGIYIVEVLDMAVRKCIEKKRNWKLIQNLFLKINV
jgi:hypothetical protein